MVSGHKFVTRLFIQNIPYDCSVCMLWGAEMGFIIDIKNLYIYMYIKPCKHVCQMTFANAFY